MARMEVMTMYNESPSTRREWIEIAVSVGQVCGEVVSLHTEGVD